MNKFKKAILVIIDGGISKMNSLKIYISKENKSVTEPVIEPEAIIEDLQFDLIPSSLRSKDPNYQCVKEIAIRLNNDKINNIALTGSFGSGKSSVLKTLQEEYKQFKYLIISLATFKTNDNISKEKTVNPSNDKKLRILSRRNTLKNKNNIIDSEERINRLLEYSILQQIIYHEKISTIPESRFKRIKNIPVKTSQNIALGITSFIVCLVILFEPSFLNVPSLYDFLSFGQTFKILTDTFCVILVIIELFIFIYYIIRTSHNSKLNKINLKDGVIEIDKENSTSIFNKHIDEIIYFFEATSYDVVIIEDLDRFDTPKIFSKLRELNSLLNNSNSIGRTITFIYAIRDDIFKDNLRTKFFDYIVTVIPIMNPYNSGDLLIQYLTEREINDISDNHCKDLGIFIDDMRLLKNIVNEFMQYKERLNQNLEAHKLLGMIIYKNYFPQDFVKLHNMDGLVYKAIKNNNIYAQKKIENIETKINILESEISNIQNQKFLSLNELRSLYVLKYLNHHPNMICFCQEQTEFKFNEMLGQENFEKLRSGIINKYKYIYNNTYHFDDITPFITIQKEVDINNTYTQRAELWNKGENNEIIMINEKLEDLKKKKQDVLSQPLKQTLSNDQDWTNSFFKDMKDHKLIIFLLQNGYIDENYYDYISFFHNGSLTASDYDFLLNIKIGRAKEFAYPLNKCESLMNNIPLSSFKKPSILNISLLDYILENEGIYSHQISGFIQLIKKKNKNGVDFLEEYISRGKNIPKIIKILTNQWSEFWNSIEISQDIPLDHKLNYLFLIFSYSDILDIKNMNIDNSISSYTKKEYSIVAIWEQVIGIERIIEIINLLGIKFDHLITNDAFKTFLERIIFEKKYNLSFENIKVVLLNESQASKLIETFETACYSAIIDSENNSLCEYVEENLNFCLENIFLKADNSIYESEDALCLLINEDAISYEIKKEYLLKQKNKISEISSINTEYWDLGLQCNILKATWENIALYYNEFEYSDALVDYLSRESTYLGSADKLYLC